MVDEYQRTCHKTLLSRRKFFVSWKRFLFLIENFRIMDKTKERLAKLSIDETGEEMKEKDCVKWDLPLVEIYKLSLKFYKGK